MNAEPVQTSALVAGGTAPEKLPEVAAQAYEPTAQDRAYLEVVQDLIDQRTPPTDGNVATRMKGPKGKPLTRQAVSKMRARPGFTAWVEASLRSERSVRRAAIESVFEIAAMRGSVKHAEFLATIHGWGGYANAAKLPGSPAAGMLTGATIGNFNLILGVPTTPAVDAERPGGVALGQVVSEVQKAS